MVAASTPIVEHALAAAELGLKVFPVIPLGKAPLNRGWQEEATTDPTTIMEWFRQNPRLNYGIPTGSANDLFVTDLDGTGPTTFWREKGYQIGAQVTTPSGPGHYHLYFRTESAEVQTNKSKIAPGVDIRGEGGFVVGPGSMLPTGTYVGDLSDIPMATDELLAIIPERQTYESIDYEGEQVEAATEDERRQVAHIVDWLQALPRVWAEGAGWHDTVFRSAAWLSRMVNSKAYALTEEAALQILMANAPTYPSWGQDKILEQWHSARTLTQGQYADPPKPSVPNLLPFIEVANALPDFTTAGEAWLAPDGPVLGLPEERTTGAMWKRRHEILVECFRAGLEPEQAVTVAWNAAAALPLQGDPNGLLELWSEAEKAKARVAMESGAAFEAPAAEERRTTLGGPQRATLMTDEERAYALGYQWFGSRYLVWAASRVVLMNSPYHRMNIWCILSLVFADAGFLPRKQGKIGLNLFLMILGKTTTGKTEALELMRMVIKACFPKGESPDIGGDASPNALVERLIERDGKPSWFNADEAHGLFKEMQGTTWRTGLREKWTAFYEGRVPPILRAGKRDISGIDATTHFIMYLMGTTEGMLEVIDAEFWTSGFLARYVFAIGQDVKPGDEQYAEDDQEGADVMKGYEAMPKQWAAEFASAKTSLKRHGALPLPIRMTDEARARHIQLKRDMDKLVAGHRQAELLAPTLRRFGISVRKCASLIAMSEGRDTVTLEHELVAIEYAEEWFGNAVYMANQTTATHLTRVVDAVEEFISKKPKGEAKPEQVYMHFKDMEKRFVDTYITQLVSQGRVEKKPVKGGEGLYVLKVRESEAIAA